MLNILHVYISPNGSSDLRYWPGYPLSALQGILRGRSDYHWKWVNTCTTANQATRRFLCMRHSRKWVGVSKKVSRADQSRMDSQLQLMPLISIIATKYTQSRLTYGTLKLLFMWCGQQTY